MIARFVFFLLTSTPQGIGAKGAVACSDSRQVGVLHPLSNRYKRESTTMAVLKPRNRLVYFRVSEEEFEQFTRVCEQEGARSISDLVRSAMSRTVNGSHADDEEPVAGRLRKLDDLIGALTLRMRQLDMLIQVQTGNGNQADRKPHTSVKETANAESA